MATKNLQLPELTAQQQEKFLSINESSHIIDAMVLPVVEGITNTVPSVNSSDIGRKWIVGTAPVSGSAWGGQANQIAIRVTDGANESWKFLAPPNGLVLYLENNSFVRYRFAGGAWARLENEDIPADVLFVDDFGPENTKTIFDTCQVLGDDDHAAQFDTGGRLALTCIGDAPSTGTGLLDGVLTVTSETNFTMSGTISGDSTVTPYPLQLTRMPNDGAANATTQRWVAKDAVFDFTKVGFLRISDLSGATNTTSIFEGVVRYNERQVTSGGRAIAPVNSLIDAKLANTQGLSVQDIADAIDNVENNIVTLGSEKLEWRGEWDDSETYQISDMVEHSGTIFVLIAEDILGDEPTITSPEWKNIFEFVHLGTEDALVLGDFELETTERICGVSGADTNPSSTNFALLTCNSDTPSSGLAKLGGVIRFTSDSDWNGVGALQSTDSSGSSRVIFTATRISEAGNRVQEWRFDNAVWDFTRLGFSLILNNSNGSVFTPALPANSFTFEFNGELTTGEPEGQAVASVEAIVGDYLQNNPVAGGGGLTEGQVDTRADNRIDAQLESGGSIATYVSENAGTTQAEKTAIAANTAKDGVSSSQATAIAKIPAIETKSNANETAISGLQTTTGELTTAQGATRTIADNNTTEIASIRALIPTDGISGVGDLTALETDIEANQSRITDAETKNMEQDSTLTELATKNTQQDEAIALNTAKPTNDEVDTRADARITRSLQTGNAIANYVRDNAGGGTEGALVLDDLALETTHTCQVQGVDSTPTAIGTGFLLSLTCIGNAPSDGTGLLDGVITINSDTNFTWNGVAYQDELGNTNPANLVATRMPNDGANDAMVQRWIVKGAVFRFSTTASISVLNLSGTTTSTSSFEGTVSFEGTGQAVAPVEAIAEKSIVDSLAKGGAVATYVADNAGSGGTATPLSAFYATNNGGIISSATYVSIQMSAPTLNQGGDMSTAGVYTAPETGVYWMSFRVGATPSENNTTLLAGLSIDGATPLQQQDAGTYSSSGGRNIFVTWTGAVALTKGQTVLLQAQTSLALTLLENECYFSGYLIGVTG